MKAICRIIISFAFCLISCSKKSASPNVVTSPHINSDPSTHDPSITSTPYYPHTDIYIGYLNDTVIYPYTPYNTGSTLSPFTFYAIHLNDTLVVFGNYSSLPIPLPAVNDTFVTDPSNTYTTPMYSYKQNTYSVTGNTLACKIQFYSPDPCPDGTYYIGYFSGTCDRR